MKKWLFGLLLLPVLAVAVLWVFRNPIVTYGLQRGGEALVGAEVWVEGLEVGPFSLDLAWERLAVADARDPWKNLVETGPCRLRLDGPPLLDGCFVVESLTAKGVVVGAARRVKARVIEGPKRSEQRPERLSLWLQRRLEAGTARFSGFQVEDGGSRDKVFEVMGAADLQTPMHVAMAQATLQKRAAGWKHRLVGRDFQRRIKAISEALKAEDVKGAEGLETLTEMREQAEGLQGELALLKGEIQAERGAVAAEVTRLKQWQGAFQGWAKQDMERAVVMAHLESQGLKRVAETLFSHLLGAKLGPIASQFEGLTALCQGVEEASDREGQRAEFLPWPRLWVKKAVVEVGAGAVRLKGTVTDFSSHHETVGEPFRYILEGSADGDAGHLVVSGEVSCLGGVCRQEGVLRVDEVLFKEVKLAPGIQLTGGDATFQATYLVEEDSPRMISRLNVRGLRVAGEGADLHWLQQALKGSLRRVPGLELQSKMLFQKGEGRWDLSSNVDAYLKVSFDEAVGRETARLKQGVRREVERRLRRYGNLLDEEIGIAQRGLLASMAPLGNELKQAELLLQAFVEAVEKERLKRQQALNEQRMKSMMKLAL
ncbi:hypothetical protein [Desulfoluna sp.]|uniref:hypothetical protein n=1 Tax=Desulfoluna sp. TaxID=2045199 RepID=UPI00261DDCE0|nr:hypothetical protein [Desulfoluna sp.]